MRKAAATVVNFMMGLFVVVEECSVGIWMLVFGDEKLGRLVLYT